MMTCSLVNDDDDVSIRHGTDGSHMLTASSGSCGHIYAYVNYIRPGSLALGIL